MTVVVTVYIQRAGGCWEAKYWHRGEERYFRFESHIKGEAIQKAARHAGCRQEREYRVVEY